MTRLTAKAMGMPTNVLTTVQATPRTARCCRWRALIPTGSSGAFWSGCPGSVDDTSAGAPVAEVGTHRCSGPHGEATERGRDVEGPTADGADPLARRAVAVDHGLGALGDSTGHLTEGGPVVAAEDRGAHAERVRQQHDVVAVAVEGVAHVEAPASGVGAGDVLDEGLRRVHDAVPGASQAQHHVALLAQAGPGIEVDDA